jgi:hypothetical protein
MKNKLFLILIVFVIFSYTACDQPEDDEERYAYTIDTYPDATYTAGDPATFIVDMNFHILANSQYRVMMYPYAGSASSYYIVAYDNVIRLSQDVPLSCYPGTSGAPETGSVTSWTFRVYNNGSSDAADLLYESDPFDYTVTWN